MPFLLQKGLYMSKIFYLFFFIAIILVDSDLIKAIVSLIYTDSETDKVFNLINMGTLSSQFYTLLGKLSVFIGVITSLFLYKNKEKKSRNFAVWSSLIVSVSYYWFKVWTLWIPIVLGGHISSTFALEFVFITLYSNLLGLAAGIFAYYISGRLVDSKINAPSC